MAQQSNIMIYRYLFPTHGGGWLRRYWQYRLQIVALEWRASDGKPLPPLTILDFTRRIDQTDASTVTTRSSADGWRVSDDRVIGGFSKSTGALVRTRHCWKRHLEMIKGQGDTASNEGSNNEDEGAILPYPFLRWYGRLDTTVGLTSKAQRSGFCALQSPEFPFDGANLRGLYNSLEIVCRDSSSLDSSSPATATTTAAAITDNSIEEYNRVFTVNLKVVSSMAEDIYQGQLSLDPTATSGDKEEGNIDSATNFQTFVLPFDEFHLTARGRDREFHRQLDDNVQIESIGFVLMDGINGNFQLDLARIRAVNRLDDGSVYEGDPAQIAPTVSERA
jgi:Complex I intermediate-associated protein 30 (CIA30)